MAGQFDKFVKILGTGSRPDRFKGAPGSPDIVASTEVATGENPDAKKMRETGVTSSGIGDPLAVARQQRSDRSKLAAEDKSKTFSRIKESRRKETYKNLSTTTMRLNEATGEAYDTEEVKPAKPKPVSNLLSKGYVKPGKRPVGPVTKGMAEGPFIDPAAAERTMANYKPEPMTNTFEMPKETAPLPKKTETPAPTNQPYNLTTGEVKAEFNDPNSINSTTLSWDPKINDARETGVRHVSPQFAKVDKIKARRGGTVHRDKDIRDFETEHPDSPASSAATGKTLSSTNKVSRYTEPSKVTSEPMTEPVTAVVEEKLTDSAHDLRASMTEGKDPDILSTTMREVPAEGPEKILGHVPVRSPRDAAPYEKPTVNKPGNVIPPMAIDTFGAQPTDRKQAEAENKRLRENRGTPVTTTVFDPNVRAARPVRGKTPERQAVLAGIREERAASLADQGKEMTTVHPAVLDTAKRLGRTSMYNLDENYMNTTGFLASEAVQKATVAHALGVHHTLGTDDDHLHKYLGGRPLEAKARLAEAYKIVDRNLRKNPEKVPGEFALLRGMVHAGSSPQQTLRAARAGKSNDVVVNGQNVTIAEGSSENRQKIANTTTNITAQAEAAPKAAKLGSIAATPTAPLAGTGRVAVRRIGQPPEKAVIREFSPQEARNRKNVPGQDDSKGPRVVDLGGLKPGEKDTNKTLKEEKDS